jgi:thiamine-phosphate pyrophosphorylase
VPHSRHPRLPSLWLMTDERMTDVLAAIARLPRGAAGIVFRHHATPPADRRRLFDAVRAIARRRRLTLLLSGTPRQARCWGAAGAHHRALRMSRGLRSVAVHDRRELMLARRAKADLVFVSPVFKTRSHPGARPLGPVRLGLLIGQRSPPVVALGGMNAVHMRRLRGLKLHGWAAIDALA